MDSGQPRTAVGIGERGAGGHPGHVRRGVEVVGLDEWEAQTLSEHRPDDGFPAPLTPITSLYICTLSRLESSRP